MRLVFDSFDTFMKKPMHKVVGGKLSKLQSTVKEAYASKGVPMAKAKPMMKALTGKKMMMKRLKASL
jgi:hypothetical protein